jgi:hypothetical protein
MGFLTIVALAFVGGAVWFVRWLFKWKDPTSDSVEGQSKAFLWSTKGTSGR